MGNSNCCLKKELMSVSKNLKPYPKDCNIINLVVRF